MNLYGSLIVYSTDTFSEHYCQTRASLPLSISIAKFHIKAFWHIENVNVMLKCRVFLFTVNRDKGVAHELFSFKFILRSP